jgi:hypothetical protein
MADDDRLESGKRRHGGIVDLAAGRGEEVSHAFIRISNKTEKSVCQLDDFNS